MEPRCTECIHAPDDGQSEGQEDLVTSVDTRLANPARADSCLFDYTELIIKLALDRAGRVLTRSQPRSVRSFNGAARSVHTWQRHTVIDPVAAELDVDQIIDQTYALVGAPTDGYQRCVRLVVETCVKTLVASRRPYESCILAGLLATNDCSTT